MTKSRPAPPAFHQASACEEAIEDRDLDALREALRHENPNHHRMGVVNATLLHFAVETYGPAVLVLLEHGANPLIPDEDGKTPLDWTVEYSVSDSVEVALRHAMRRQQQADEARALHQALDTAPLDVPIEMASARSRL